jgi:hypothetical protein
LTIVMSGGCEADVRNFMRNKRKATNWKLVVQLAVPKSGGKAKP